MNSRTLIRSGSFQPRPAPVALRAGPLTMCFEPDTTFLRHLRLGDHEVVRAIYALVRDRNWATLSSEISNLKSQISKDAFQLAFDVRCRRDEIDFSWHGTITGEASGQVTFAFDGRAHTTFLRNRIGICVLHPLAECAGKPIALEHTDGSVTRGSFPRTISPNQPFLDIRSLSYEVAGNRAELRFSGDIFEMEDQRNWSDASFKTYCTPLARPLPATVEAGTRIQQSVTLRLEAPVRPVLPVVLGRPPQLSIATTPVLPLPPIGACVPIHGEPLSERQAQRLRALKLAHLRVDLKLSSGDYAPLLEQAVAQANALGVGLHLAVTVSNAAEAELKALGGVLGRLRPNVALWLVFHEAEPATGEPWVRLARELLQSHAPGALFAAGSADFFTELNRNRPPADATAFPCFPINPQVHAFDDLSLVENLAGQVANVETANSFSPKPAVVSPITLKIRCKWGLPAAQAGELPGDVDPRQMSLFGAGWTLGSLARLAAAGKVHSLTYYETTGWRGLMATEAGSPLPEKFPAEPGVVFPVYHVLADLAEFPGRQVYPTISSHPLLVEGLTLTDGKGRRRVLVANLTGDVQEVKIKTGTCAADIRYLDETNATQAMREPEAFRALAGDARESAAGKIELRLLPFAVARVEIR